MDYRPCHRTNKGIFIQHYGILLFLNRFICKLFELLLYHSSCQYATIHNQVHWYASPFLSNRSNTSCDILTQTVVSCRAPGAYHQLNSHPNNAESRSRENVPVVEHSWGSPLDDTISLAIHPHTIVDLLYT